MRTETIDYGEIERDFDYEVGVGLCKRYWVISAARDLRKKQLILGREGFEKEDRLPWERECFCG